MKLRNIQVSAYSGYKANEKPRNFIFEGKKYTIEEIIYQAYEKTIDGGLKRRFNVKTDGGSTFKLCYDENQDQWFLEE